MTEIMRPLHDLISRPNSAETMDEIEFRNTHETHLCDKDRNLRKLEGMIQRYIADDNPAPLEEIKQKATTWVYSYR